MRERQSSGGRAPHCEMHGTCEHQPRATVATASSRPMPSPSLPIPTFYLVKCHFVSFPKIGTIHRQASFAL